MRAKEAREFIGDLILKGLTPDHPIKMTRYKDALILVDTADGASYVVEFQYIAPYVNAEKLGLSAAAVLLNPSKGDQLTYDGAAWAVSRRDGWHYAIDEDTSNGYPNGGPAQATWASPHEPESPPTDPEEAPF